MKRFGAAAFAVLCLMAQMPTASAVGTSASCAILMDAGSGRVLYEQEAHQPRLIASTTKLLTALVALESGHELDERVTIDPAWAGAEGSSIYLRAGEEVTLETLLYGMLLRSGNDAALAVAGCCGGTVEDFVAKMNAKAAELGMTDSHFANPNGLNDEEHYSTAYDMALLARACLENESLARMVATKSATFGTRTFTNHNKLLWRYEGCIGMKTGYTEKAGRTLVSAAQRDGLTLICVTLNDPNDWADHAALFDYGFEHYQSAVLAEMGQEVGHLPVEGGLVPACPIETDGELTAALSPEEQAEVETVLEKTILSAPVACGQRVGEQIYTLDGRELARIPLVTGSGVACDTADKVNFLDNVLERLARFAGLI